MDIRYIELKTGYSDNGPAWIGKALESKSGRTVYFNDHAFHRQRGEYSNYRDVETGEDYWISCVKKNGEDRHWAGGGKVVIDRKVIGEYLETIQAEKLDASRFIVEDIEDRFPVERINALMNEKGHYSAD